MARECNALELVDVAHVKFVVKLQNWRNEIDVDFSYVLVFTKKGVLLCVID